VCVCARSAARAHETFLAHRCRCLSPSVCVGPGSRDRDAHRQARSCRQGSCSSQRPMTGPSEWPAPAACEPELLAAVAPLDVPWTPVWPAPAACFAAVSAAMDAVRRAAAEGRCPGISVGRATRPSASAWAGAEAGAEAGASASIEASASAASGLSLTLRQMSAGHAQGGMPPPPLPVAAGAADAAAIGQHRAHQGAGADYRLGSDGAAAPATPRASTREAPRGRQAVGTAAPDHAVGLPGAGAETAALWSAPSPPSPRESRLRAAQVGASHRGSQRWKGRRRAVDGRL